MKINVTAICSILLVLAEPISAQHFTREYVRENGTCGRWYEVEFSEDVEIATNVLLKARISVSNRGNGSLSIGKTEIPVWKEQKEYAWYEDGMLAVTFIDLNADAVKEMVISGIENFGGEWDDEVYVRNHILSVYDYNMETTEFDLRDMQSPSVPMLLSAGEWCDEITSGTNPVYAVFRQKEAEKCAKYKGYYVREREETSLQREMSFDQHLGGGLIMSFVWVGELNGWCGKYEVTNGEFRRFNPDHDSKNYDGQSLNGDRQPVVYVTWNDAQAYIRWLNKHYTLPDEYEFTLPSENEWKTVMQCGDGRKYPWGNNWRPETGQIGNYADSSLQSQFPHLSKRQDFTDGFVVTCPVEESGRNEWGIYGVGGNAEEWTNEKHVISEVPYYAIRGGSWFRHDAEGFQGVEDHSMSTLGFRLFILREESK